VRGVNRLFAAIYAASVVREHVVGSSTAIRHAMTGSATGSFLSAEDRSAQIGQLCGMVTN